MKNLTSGQNSFVEDANIKITVHCSINVEQQSELDVSAFLLKSDGKVRSDSDFIFYNQPQAKDKSIALLSQDDENQYFTVDLGKIPPDIQKIAFVITSPAAFLLAKALSIEIENTMAFHPDTKTMQEKSLILAELYRYKDAWKFRALGHGFQGGLAPLATGYGVDIGDEKDTQPESAPKIPPKPSHAPQPTIPANKPLRLEKVSIDLRKPGEKATISLSKGGKITAKLKWDTNSDLDLYCFYVDSQDREDKVYYRKLGSSNKPPYIKLLGDSQTAGEEVLEIYQPQQVKYALIAAYSAISNGIGSFYSYKARVVVSDNERQEVTSHLAHKDPFSYWVAFALVDFTKPGEVTIKNVETYSNKKTFAKQFEERTGKNPFRSFLKSKANVNGVSSYDPERSPYLFKDGTFMMSVGVREFK